MLKKFHLFLLHYALNRLLSKLSEARVPVDIHSWEMFDQSKTAELFIGESIGIEIDKNYIRLWDGNKVVREISLIQFKFDFRDKFIEAIVNQYYFYHNKGFIGDINLN
jgi:hypothetical protein